MVRGDLVKLFLKTRA